MLLWGVYLNEPLGGASIAPYWRMRSIRHSSYLNYSSQIAVERDLVKKEINNILRQRSEFLIHRTRQRYYFHGSRPSHLLAMKIRSN